GMLPVIIPARLERRRLGRPPAGQSLQRREGQRVQPRAVAGELELVGGVAEEGVAEEVVEGGAHGDMVRPERSRMQFLLFLLLLFLLLQSPFCAPMIRQELQSQSWEEERSWRIHNLRNSAP
ncbi:MAG: hypothetical protein FD180_4178, partial [Planctomycetota bacterium]